MDDYRHRGLRFNCNEQYVRGHNKSCQWLFILELGDDDGNDDNAINDDMPHILLHTIAGVQKASTMQMQCNIGGVVLNAQLDSGSTHNFVSESTTARTRLPLQGRENMHVMVANDK